ncbi:MAG: CoA transferase [Actinobacteria bacterium]|nr:CoA transferase [Actinomycetota bacterium]
MSEPVAGTEAVSSQPADSANTADGFLAGINVLDLASVGPAARCSRTLADFGARVVKVGPVPANAAAQITPPAYAYGGHRYMSRAQIDLKAPDGKAAFLALAAAADVVIESFRPGVVDRLGIGFAEVSEINPGIVYCSTTGFGQSGPAASWAGHDLNYLAVSGFLATGEPGVDGRPTIPGATIADGAGGGMHAVISIMAALIARSNTGVGAYLDVSVLDGMMSLMSLFGDEYLATGQRPGWRHNILTGRYACYGIYRTADGKWMSVAAIEPVFYRNLCRLLDCERWADHQSDDSVQDRIRDSFQSAFLTDTQAGWTERLSGHDTCAAPVLTLPDALAEPQVVERGLVVAAQHPEAGTFDQIGPSLAGMSRTQQPIELPDWTRTETESLLGAVGYSPETIAELKDAGVIA